MNEKTIHAEEPSAERTCCKQHSSGQACLPTVYEIPRSGIAEVSVNYYDKSYYNQLREETLL